MIVDNEFYLKIFNLDMYYNIFCDIPTLKFIGEIHYLNDGCANVN